MIDDIEHKIKIEPLLECLVIIAKLHNKPLSAEALTAGLPLEHGESVPQMFSIEKAKSNFSRAAKRAGFSSTLIKRELGDISSLLLPVILVLHDGNACILEGFNSEHTHAKVIIPELGESEQWVRLDDLENEYLGYAFLLKPTYRYETRSLKLITPKQEHWFWGTLWRSRSIYANVIAASLLINIFVLAGPLFAMNVYDRVVPNNAIATLWVLAIGVLVIYLFDIGLKFLRSYFLEIAAKKSDVVMSSILFEQVMNLKMSVWPKSVGSFASNLKEFDTIRNFFTSSTVAALVDLPFVTIFLFVIYLISGSIVIVPMVMIAAILTYSFFIKEPLKKSIESTYEAAANKNAILIESLSNIETIKTLGTGGHAQWDWEEATGEIATKSVRSSLLSSSISTVTSFLVQFNTVAVIIFGVYMIEQMELSLGGLIAAVILSGRAIAPMGQAAALLASYQQTKTAYETLEQIMKMPVERPEGKNFVERPNFHGKIEFNHVSFAYPDETKQALSDVSFTLNPGEKVGIIGQIGSGKTTIEKLALGLFSPDKGSIFIDGIDINQIDPADLRKNIGYIPQEVSLFRGTVKENILYKSPHIEDSQILKAAKISTAETFINQHPLGFNMPIQEKGVGLSTGQKQSIAIARIVLTDPPIIIMDEPSNSLDNTTEARLIGNLKVYLEDKTVLLSTHKFSLLELVDRLIVMDRGKIILDGPKEKVMKILNKGTA